LLSIARISAVTKENLREGDFTGPIFLGRCMALYSEAAHFNFDLTFAMILQKLDISSMQEAVR
jgi:hypothetical protein